jgi:hypothetical protein
VVGQVKIVGILMIVHGITVVVMGGFYGVMGGVLMAAPPPPPAGGGPPPGFFAAMTWIYVALGALIALPGLLNVIAGVQLIRYRGRTLAIVALFSNALALISCYCIPTIIGMMIYGLIVLFNTDVAWAFDQIARGKDPNDVVRRFNPRYGDERDDFDDNHGGPRYREERRVRWDDDEDDRRRDQDRD